MIREERLLKVLRAPHVSEKSVYCDGKTNTIVLQVAKERDQKQKSKLLCEGV